MARRATGTRAAALVLITALTCATLAACSTGSGGTPQGVVTSVVTASPSETPNDGSSSGTSTGSSSSAPPSSAVVTVAPVATKKISPTTPITVTVQGGTLTDVRLTNGSGKQVKGTQSTDGLSWTNSEPLGYGKDYTLSAKATGVDGAQVVRTAQYTTLTPPNMTMPSFQYTGGYALQDGATYGVGIIPIVHWDEPITDKAAAVKTLTISTTPHVAGAWYWSDDQNVAFRPQQYWPAHTKVSISVKDYGKKVSPGLYGQSDISTSFKIGDKHVTIAHDNAPKVNKVDVYFNDKLVKRWNTSMGKHEYVYYGGQKISYYTMDGTYTVIAHENPARMTSASYGLPVNAPGGYDELIYWATKISTDGIYLHQLESTVWNQDHGQDVSHGCLNLRGEYAKWFYNHSLIGDVVEVRGTKDAPKINYWQGGAWSVPWSTWTKGGFLAN